VIPAELAWLFWDVDPATIDLDRHRDYVVERIMARGDWVAMRWLARHVEREALADFLRRKGHRLAPRERAFWSLIAGVPHETESGGGRPPWAGKPW
jgi:hypothetical protein